MCNVLHARRVGRRPAPHPVNVGRPTKWGNPFVIGRKPAPRRPGDARRVVARYRAWIAPQPALLAALDELRGKHLVCWCAPERCHAEVLLDLAKR